MGEDIKFEKVRAEDGIHDGDIRANGYDDSANIWALGLIALAVTTFGFGLLALMMGVFG